MVSFYLAIVVAFSLALLPLSRAQNAPADYVRVHNNARAKVNVGKLQWDAKLAVLALNYVNTLSASGRCHPLPSGSGYGENMAFSRSELSGASAVNDWVGEKRDYNYSQNKCASGRVCEHYTQVVWRDSVRLGCGRVKCKSGATLISCNYDPPGNSNGQRPYELLSSF